MKKTNILKYAAVHALGAALYVALVVTLIENEALNAGGNETLTAFAVLMLFSVSAGIMASLIFGRPLMWYLDGKKKEAVKLVGATIGFMAIITMIAVYLLS